MNRRVIFFITFLTLLSGIYIIFSLIYSRGQSDLPEIILYYSVLPLFVLCVDLIKIRKVKWLIVHLINFVVLAMVILGAFTPDISSLYLLVEMSQLNIPFLPRLHLKIIDDFIRIVVYYLIYFLSPLFYWYAVYYASKKEENIFGKRLK